MRKVIVTEFMTLDGILQAPGGPEEDSSGGFKFGGWLNPFFDEITSEVMTEQMKLPFDLLLGRKTYDIFASYWPHHSENWTGINDVNKYVASYSNLNLDWNNSILLDSPIEESVKKLKSENGPRIQVYGSANLIQTLLMHDLVDELWLKIYPITLGKGKRLFDNGTIPATFKLTSGQVSPSGVIVANYERAGEIVTGSF